MLMSALVLCIFCLLSVVCCHTLTNKDLYIKFIIIIAHLCDVVVYGSVTLVLLPLKYEIDDSVTVTVVLLGEAGRCTLMGGT